VIAQLARANVMMTLEWRTGVLILMLNSVAGPTVSLLVWLTVREYAAGALPLDRPQLVTYFLLMSVVSMLTDTWAGQYVAADIRHGSLSKALMRPAPPILHDIGNNLGEKGVKIWLMLPLVAVVALFFRDDVRLTTDPLRWVAFGAALVLASALTFLLDYVIGTLAFWLQDVSGISTLNALLEGLLAGRFVPLALFPAQAAPLLAVQPWRYVLSFPLEIASGALPGEEIARGLAVQLGYVAALIGVYRVTWRAGLRVYAAVGR
jgi:ABC-2 type transport system permease protein